MKINKNWEPSIVKCPHCKKEFEVKFELFTHDNCLPAMSEYNFERIFYGHVDDENWTDEETLQWFNILNVLFLCPHCHNSYGSTCNCSVCRKPIHHWMGSPSGVTCSSKCYNTYTEWQERAKEKGHSGVIPREAIYGKDNVFSNDKIKENARRKTIKNE